MWLCGHFDVLRRLIRPMSGASCAVSPQPNGPATCAPPTGRRCGGLWGAWGVRPGLPLPPPSPPARRWEDGCRSPPPPPAPRAAARATGSPAPQPQPSPRRGPHPGSFFLTQKPSPPPGEGGLGRAGYGFSMRSSGNFFELKFFEIVLKLWNAFLKRLQTARFVIQRRSGWVGGGNPPPVLNKLPALVACYDPAALGPLVSQASGRPPTVVGRGGTAGSLCLCGLFRVLRGFWCVSPKSKHAQNLCKAFPQRSREKVALPP